MKVTFDFQDTTVHGVSAPITNICTAYKVGIVRVAIDISMLCTVFHT